MLVLNLDIKKQSQNPEYNGPNLNGLSDSLCLSQDSLWKEKMENMKRRDLLLIKEQQRKKLSMFCGYCVIPNILDTLTFTLTFQ